MTTWLLEPGVICLDFLDTLLETKITLEHKPGPKRKFIFQPLLFSTELLVLGRVILTGRGWETQAIPSKSWSSTWKMARQEADSSCAVCVPTSQPTVVVQVGTRGIFVVPGAVQPFRSQWLKNYPTFWKSMVGRWSIFFRPIFSVKLLVLGSVPNPQIPLHLTLPPIKLGLFDRG